VMDSTDKILRDLITGLQRQQAAGSQPSYEGLYLLAADDQFLGEVSTSPFESTSLANRYGPFGSPYSTTSIFNQYSEYGSPYGVHSIRNPYASNPPALYRAGTRLAPVSKNPYLRDRIDADVFLAALKDPAALSRRNVDELRGVSGLRGMTRGFIEAQDGTLLGSLRPDKYDSDSIFNSYGPFGSKYSPASIFNPYSPYGDRYSNLSCRNPSATSPPRIVVEGQFKAYLTTNKRLSPSVDPDALLAWSERNVKKW
jgi:hypothetical protein